VSDAPYGVRPGTFLARLPLVGGLAAAVGVALLASAGPGHVRQLYFSYLTAFIYFLSIALGALFFVLLHHATRAGWSVVVRRAAESLAGTLPVFALLFVPVVMGARELFPWMQPHAHTDELLQHRAPYLNPGFFYTRAIVVFLIWTILAAVYRRGSIRQDRTGDHAITRRLQTLSAPGLALFAITITAAAFDWLMALDAHWYSTMFGVYFFAGAVVSMFALLALLALGLRGTAAGSAITVEHLHDLGKLLFAFTCFWGYIAFSQFMLMWYANIPEETVFFMRRLAGSWRALSIFLAAGHFGAPFLFLLPRTVKRSGPGLFIGAAWMLLCHYADIYWLVMPNLHADAAHPQLLDLAAVLGVGGVFLAVAGWLLRRAPVIPVAAPRLTESLHFENSSA
jgi:hypothetical protein